MLIERFVHDVRYAARGLRRSPGFTLTAVAVLALGIGANTAIFSVAKDVLLRPLSYPEPDRLVQYISRSRTGKSALASVPKYLAWRDLMRLHESITAYYGGGPGVTLVEGDRREHLTAIYATASYFHVFRAPILYGRAFSYREDQPQGPKVAVISHAFAMRRFGRSGNVIGHLLPLGETQYEIVGILGPKFQSFPQADVFMPLQAPPRVSFDHTNYLTVVARLRPGVPIAKVDRALAEMTGPFHQIFPDTTAPYEQFGAEPLEHMLAGDSRPALQLLSAAVICVLLIACANAANLFVVRSTRRKGDIATRAALGAGRVRLFRQLFTECVLLALGGGALGVVVGYAGIRALLMAVPGALGDLRAVSADGTVMLFALGMSLLTAVTFGLLPVLRASRVNLSAALKDNAADGTIRGSNRRQSLLVIGEMTLAIVLLVGAGLLIRTFMERRAIDRGFRSTGVLTLDLPLNESAYTNGPAVNELVRNMTRRLDDVPGARAVAASYALPLDASVSFPFTLLDRALSIAPYHGVGHWRSVSPDYFSVFAIPLLRGRLLEETDDEKGMPVVVINRAMARKFWQDNDPTGHRLIIGKATDREYDHTARVIVGVVGDVRGTGLNPDPEPMLYVPIAQTGDRIMARNNRFVPLTWAVRTEVDDATVRTALRRELREASGGLMVSRVRRIEDIVRAATAQLEFTSILLGVFAAAALVLAAVGLYGLMAYSVEQRRQEIGIRLALGAEPATLRNMVLVQGGQLTAAGVCLGLGAAVLLARVMASVVVGMAPWDTRVFFAVGMLLAIVALAAAYLPAQDATRIDPLTVLKRT